MNTLSLPAAGFTPMDTELYCFCRRLAHCGIWSYSSRIAKAWKTFLVSLCKSTLVK